MSAVRASFPGGAFAQTSGPETNKVTLGFIALTDSSPLIIAKEKKLFDKYGITDANVAKQASWGRRATIPCWVRLRAASTAPIS